MFTAITNKSPLFPRFGITLWYRSTVHHQWTPLHLANIQLVRLSRLIIRLPSCEDKRKNKMELRGASCTAVMPRSPPTGKLPIKNSSKTFSLLFELFPPFFLARVISEWRILSVYQNNNDGRPYNTNIILMKTIRWNENIRRPSNVVNKFTLLLKFIFSTAPILCWQRLVCYTMCSRVSIIKFYAFRTQNHHKSLSFQLGIKIASASRFPSLKRRQQLPKKVEKNAEESAGSWAKCEKAFSIYVIHSF